MDRQLGHIIDVEPQGDDVSVLGACAGRDLDRVVNPSRPWSRSWWVTEYSAGLRGNAVGIDCSYSNKVKIPDNGSAIVLITDDHQVVKAFIDVYVLCSLKRVGRGWIHGRKHRFVIEVGTDSGDVA